ncbi:MAG: Clp protease N-terminal domain-containing protein [Vicinamibacterales bacterium]
MFERYTERARRVLFFARYEASQLGSVSIETEHLLLGLLREGKGVTGRIFARAHVSFEAVRREIEQRTVFRKKISTSVEMPFSAEAKRVLAFAAEEADRLLHNYIGTEHLLLGLLREEGSVAASVLMEKGMRLQTVRDDIVRLLNEKPALAGDAEEDFTTHIESVVEPVAVVRADAPAVPDFMPSHVVHIVFSRYSPAQERWIQHAGQAWRAYGFTLAQIVAHAWGSDEARVSLDAPHIQHADTRYDFWIVLPPVDGPERVPALLRESIQEQFGVDVTRADGDPPRLVVKSR